MSLTSDLKRQMAAGAALEAELNKERAAALGRSAQKLEASLEECRALANAVRAASPHARPELVRRYDEAWKHAETQRWNLCVQREAIGLRRHDDVDAMYPRPPRRVGD